MDNSTNYDILVAEKFQLNGRLTSPEYYVDGISQMFLGYPITKTLFHTIAYPGNGDRKEQRKASHLLTMPTIRAVEYANLILTAAKNSEPQLLEDISPRERKKLLGILNRFQLDEEASQQMTNLSSTIPEKNPKSGKLPKTEK
ncbi:hypothetical protein [Azonexus hydrophilus]|uniref:hypothetical protein n=1 Tax=Azonexus hydrophilus TaxID=418702 RepID=UPI001115950F|nr:hypothetical protein [Azonexus hydrophilus]